LDDKGAVLIFGASARAAAFSALRAGLSPWCADLFADADLRQRVPAMRLPGRYPDGFLELINAELPGPWMYSSGLENRPFLVRKMARRRPLLGNDQPALLAARSPFTVAAALKKDGHSGPAVWGPGAPFPPVGRRWLIKPLVSTGGSGIRHLVPELLDTNKGFTGCYLQEYVEGESRSAVFVADGQTAELIGMTRQLVGQEWLNAVPFHYCGSIGPVTLSVEENRRLGRLGNTLTAACGLRGLFGVDGIWRGGTLWPVEINPRYTASVEVLEYASGTHALSRHVEAFDGKPLAPWRPTAVGQIVGKGILFARNSIDTLPNGPWSSVLNDPPPIDVLPSFADIPPAGTPVHAGHPVLTIFAHAATVDACEQSLRSIAGDLDRTLFGR
jgi:uncharacterized protein